MRILIAVNVDWFFLSHRLPVALEAVQAGHDVHVATTITQDHRLLEGYGFTVHHLNIDRSSVGPLGLIVLFWQFLRLLWLLRPDVAHFVTIKPVLIGGLAARFSPVKGVVYAISGLGHVFVAHSFPGRVRRALVGGWYRIVLGARNMRIIFQNPDDRRALEQYVNLAPEKVVMIPGSGVDLSEYAFSELPPEPPIVMMAARLLATKGVNEFVQAAQQLRQDGVVARFWLVGAPDTENPAGIRTEVLEAWRHQEDVEVLGHRSDISELMRQAHLVVLPSYYGEGLPKVLIEAAACGRAVITTDMPGCRDAIEAGSTGLLVPPRDASALAAAMLSLIEDRDRCAAMGAAGRRRAEQVFDISAVVATHMQIYAALGEQR